MKKKEQLSTLMRRKRRAPYILLAPGLILIVLLMGYPLIYSIRLSMLNYKLLRPNDVYFNGLENFQKLFTNPDLLLILRNSLVWVVVVVFFQFVLGFLIAMLLNGATFRGKGIYQSIIFVPWAIAGFLIGLIFKWMFSQHNGVINYFLVELGIISQPISWLGSSQYSMIPAIVSMIWYGIPFFGIMILAALQSVPQEMLESADIDGASYFQKFFKVIIPYIKPTILVTLLLRIIWVFNSSDTIYVTTGGGPANSSNILPLYVFDQAYNTMDFGYGAAAGLLMMLFLCVFALVYLRISKYEEAGDF